MSTRNKKKKKKEVCCDVERSRAKKERPQPRHSKQKDEDLDWSPNTKKVKPTKTYTNKKKDKPQQQREASASKPLDIPVPECSSSMYVNPVTTTPYTQTYKEEKRANVQAWVNSNPYAMLPSSAPTPVLQPSTQAPKSRATQPRAPAPPLTRRQMENKQSLVLYKLARIINTLEEQLVEFDKERKTLKDAHHKCPRSRR